MRFTDRLDAGCRLARLLKPYARKDVVVVGLPRGGVPVAFEVAHALRAPLDVIVVRKLGMPGRPELAMGAVGENGVRVLNDDVIRAGRIRPQDLGPVEAREQAEVERRAEVFRNGRPAIPLARRTVIVVDDGIATGATARAACQVARASGAAEVVMATPVCPPDVARRLEAEADAVICLSTPLGFQAVGQYYQDFAQTSDEEVTELLRRAAQVRLRKRDAPSERRAADATH